MSRRGVPDMVHGQTSDGGLTGFIKASLQPTESGEKACEKKLKLSTESELLSPLFFYV